MKVVGISKIVSNVNPEGIGQLWKRFYSENISDKIPNKTSNGVVAVYTRYEGDYTKPYTIIIGHEVAEISDVPDLDSMKIDNAKHTKYAVAGKMPDVVIEKWQEIWSSTKGRAYIADYDIYHPDGNVEIFVEFSE